MVNHVRRWQQSTNCLSVFDHFAGLTLKGLNRGLGLVTAVHFQCIFL